MITSVEKVEVLAKFDAESNGPAFVEQLQELVSALRAHVADGYQITDNPLTSDQKQWVFTLQKPQTVEPSPLDLMNAKLDASIDTLTLSIRSYNCLKNANIRTIRELVQKTPDQLLKGKNFSRKVVREIEALLAIGGLRLGMKLDAGSQP